MAVGLCGSDRHWYVEGGIGDAVISRPLVLGHEIVAAIESGPNKGQVVVVDPAIPCGTCELCAGGLGHLCREVRFAGHGATDGGLRQLMAWPRGQLELLPDSIAGGERHCWSHSRLPCTRWIWARSNEARASES